MQLYELIRPAVQSVAGRTVYEQCVRRYATDPKQRRLQVNRYEDAVIGADQDAALLPPQLLLEGDWIAKVKSEKATFIELECNGGKYKANGWGGELLTWNQLLKAWPELNEDFRNSWAEREHGHAVERAWLTLGMPACKRASKIRATYERRQQELAGFPVKLRNLAAAFEVIRNDLLYNLTRTLP